MKPTNKMAKNIQEITNMYFILFVSLLILTFGFSAPSLASFPGTNDYQCDINRLVYSDNVGRIINTNFSSDTFTTIYNEGQTEGMPAIVFSSTSVTGRPASETEADYRMFSYLPEHPEGTLHLSNGICLIGVNNSGETNDGGACIPINFGVEDSLDMQLEVEFDNFKNIAKNQYAYYFDICMGSNSPSVEGAVSGVWFTGTFGGKSYENALIIFASVENKQIGEEIESDLVAVEGLPYLETSVTLKMQVQNNGYTLVASYKINDEPWQNIPQLNSSWQITGYSGSGADIWNVPTISLGAEYLVIDGADADRDGVINELDQCPNTLPNSYVDMHGCKNPINCDVDGDGQTGLAEAINALQIVSGQR